MVRLAQTMNLSCNDTNIVSNRTETRFHMAHITKALHWLRPKQFLSLWLRKSCTYLASRLALSPNGLKRATTKPRYLGFPSGAYRMISEPLYGWRKPCTFLAPTLTLSPNGPKWDFTWPMSPRSSIGCVRNDFWAYDTFSANRAPILHPD
jgi:hypothetical protein